jgi:hypothetical protein
MLKVLAVLAVVALYVGLCHLIGRFLGFNDRPPSA